MKEAMEKSESLAGDFQPRTEPRSPWRSRGPVCFAVLALGLLPWLDTASGNKESKVLEADKFILRDARGKKRAEFGLHVGIPSLTYSDEATIARFQLALTGQH